MREIRQSGSEGGGDETNRLSLPLFPGVVTQSLKIGDCTGKLKSWAAATGSVSADGGSRIVAASAQMTGST
jgi:hypothetical protein